VKRAHNFHYLDSEAKWLYLTSLGEEWNNPYERAIHYSKEHNAHLAFNPGTRQLAQKYAVIKDALTITEILFVNKEEAEQLVKDYTHDKPSNDMKELLSQVAELGPKMVVITNGRYGSYVLASEKRYYHQDIFPSIIVERTGAGDAFASGFLAGFVQDVPIQEAMQWGTFNAGGVVAQIGAQAGLLNKSQMEEKIKSL